MSFADRLADRLVPPPPPSQEEVFARLGYTPQPKQWEFHRATEFDVMYGGAAGGGKTKAVVMHALWAGVAHPGIRVAIFRRTFDELAESVIPELSAVGFGEDLGYVWNATASELRVKGSKPSVIRLRYLENLVDASRRQGGAYQLVIFEERTQLGPGIADIIVNERVRTAVGSGVPVLGVRCTSNPGSASHSEVKARYIDSTNHGAEVAEFCPGCHLQRGKDCICGNTDQPETVRFIPARVTDNAHVDPGYRARLMGIKDAARRAAMLDGSWDSFAGQVFREWRHDRHVVDPWPLPETWQRYMGVDWGFTAPWCALWGARDEDGRLWVYRELYEPGVGEHDQARRILAAEEGDPVPFRVGDPAMAAKRGDAESIMAAYATEGVHLEPANNDRLGGWQRIHSYLAEAAACPHHRARGWETCPMLHVFSGCANLIRELPALPYDPHRVEDVDTKASDHAADALRYLAMSIGQQATFFVPQDGARTTALDGTPLHEPFGPFAKPPEPEHSEWFIPQ